MCSCLFPTNTAPGTPQNLRSIATSETSITVQWDAVPCIDRNSPYEITGYKLRRTGYSREEAIPRSRGEGGMYTITGLSPLTTYSIEVAAVSNSGTGPFTSITVQTPLRIYGRSAIQEYCSIEFLHLLLCKSHSLQSILAYSGFCAS